jgi:hypothetical protein
VQGGLKSLTKTTQRVCVCTGADAAVPHPDGGHQGQAPPAPKGGTPVQPHPPCCERPGV